MGIVPRPDVYMLMRSGQGWQPNNEYSRVVDQGSNRFTVQRGNLAQVFDTTRNLASLTSIEVQILDEKDMKMVPLVSDLKLVAARGDQKYQLLRGIQDLEKRYDVVISGKHEHLASLSVGSKVLYLDQHGTGKLVPAVVRFLGQGPEGRPGWMLGIEIQSEGWSFGHTSGAFQGRQYFDKLCKEEKGIFCDISLVELEATTMNCDTSVHTNNYHPHKYTSGLRGSWSQDSITCNNNIINTDNNGSCGDTVVERQVVKGGGKHVNNFLGKLGTLSSNIFVDRDADSLISKLHVANIMDGSEKPGLRRKHSFSSSERPTSRSSSSDRPHSRPNSRVQGSLLRDGDAHEFSLQSGSGSNKNSQSSDSFSWNPNSNKRKDSKPPRKSPSPKFFSSLSAASGSTSNSSSSKHSEQPRHSASSSWGEQRKVSSGSPASDFNKVRKNSIERKVSGQSSSSSNSDRKYVPAVYEASGGRNSASTDTDSTVPGFGRSWDEMSKMTGYSIMEFKNGKCEMAAGGDKSYSDKVRAIINTMPQSDEDNTLSGSNRNENSWSSEAGRQDSSEISLHFQQTQADSDDLALPFGRTLSRASANTHSSSVHQQHHPEQQHQHVVVHPRDFDHYRDLADQRASHLSPDDRLWDLNSGSVLDQQTDFDDLSRHFINQRSGSVDDDHIGLNTRSDLTINPAYNSQIRTSLDSGLESPRQDHSIRSHSKPPSGQNSGARVRSRQGGGHRTAPFHRTGSSFGRKTPVPAFQEDSPPPYPGDQEEEQQHTLDREDADCRTWGEVLKGAAAVSPKGVASHRHKNLRREEEEESLREPVFDQLTPDWLKEDLCQVVAGSMVQLEQDSQPLFGVVRWRGSLVGDSVELVGVGNDAGDLVGVELEDQIPAGGNGTHKGRNLFSCAEGKGVFVPLTHVRPDPRFTESLNRSGVRSTSPNGVAENFQEFGGLDCEPEPGIFPPRPAVESVNTISGRNRGIQGHQNSCYLDATLFSMFAFCSVFDSLLYRPRNKDDISQYEEVQRVLRDEIVNPLRNKLFVRADRVLGLRKLLDSLSSVSGLMDQEKDPEEFLNSLLNQVLKASPYLELTSGQTSHTYQLFVEKDPNIKIPTVQVLFDQSFLTSAIKFKKVPPILILQMPRFGTQFKMYERIIPSLVLDITDVIEGMPRQCTSCGCIATVECLQCYGDRESGLQSTAFCSSCFSRLHHNNQKRGLHRGTRLYEPAGRKKESNLSRVNMQLVAVICIETSHYVSFVRCGDTLDSKWAFFDSMADRKGEQNGYNIPELTAVPEVDYVLSSKGADQLRDEPNLPLTEHARRLVADSYICIYQSEEARMYD